MGSCLVLTVGAWVATLSQYPDFKSVWIQISAALLLWLHLVCSSCRAPMAWCFLFSFFGLFFNALSAFYNPTCGWIDLFSLQIWGRKEQQPQCNCNPCASSDDLLFTVPCVHRAYQWLKHWSLLCRLVVWTHLSNRSLFWQRKALLTSLATTCENTFSPP